MGIDWLNVTGPMAVLDRTERVIVEADGGRPVTGRGMEGFERCQTWPSGVKLFSGHSSSRWWVQLSGSACGNLGGDAVHAIGQRIMQGGTCTRLDIRRDLRGEGLTLVSDIIEACERRELRRLRQHAPYPRYEDGELIGHGVVLGSYKSARFVRCYDKGLEQRTMPPGQWVRFETQLREDHSHEAAMAIFGAPTAEWGQVAFQHLAGVVDFRVGADRNIDRLPQPSFWAHFLGGVEACRTRALPRDVDAARWVEALCVQYGAALSLAADLAGVTLEEACRRVFAGVTVNEGTRNNPVVCKLADWIQCGYDLA